MFDQGFFQNTLTPILAIIGATTGIVGSILGIYNYRLQAKSYRVKVRVLPRIASRTTEKSGEISGIEIGIEIFNDSYFDVTIHEVGFVLKKSRFAKKQYVPLPLRSHQAHVKRLNARDKWMYTLHLNSQVIMSNDNVFLGNLKTFPTIEYAKSAYIILATGERFVGNGKRFEKIIETLQKIKSYYINRGELQIDS